MVVVLAVGEGHTAVLAVHRCMVEVVIEAAAALAVHHVAEGMCSLISALCLFANLSTATAVATEDVAVDTNHTEPSCLAQSFALRTVYLLLECSTPFGHITAEHYLL